MTALVIIEHDNGQLNPASLSAITAAQLMAESVNVLVLSEHANIVAEALVDINGIDEIFLATSSTYNELLAEPCADCIVKLCRQLSDLPITHVVAAATSFGKNLLPRVAACLDVAQVSDIISVIDSNTFKRPIYAGNAIETVQSSDPLQVVSIRATAFAPAASGNDGDIKITVVDILSDHTASTFINRSSQTGDLPQLTTADIVISGGRGLKDAERFERLNKIAHRLHAALGASRAAVDAGLAPNELQVGQTGQIVAPKLYIAVGISGAMQHLAGMKDSQIIVAINKDPDAPIFQIADYGLIADIDDILPEWEALLDAEDQ